MIYRQTIGIEFAMDITKIEIEPLSIPGTGLQNCRKKLSITFLPFARLERARVKIFKIDKETIHSLVL